MDKLLKPFSLLSFTTLLFLLNSSLLSAKEKSAPPIVIERTPKSRITEIRVQNRFVEIKFEPSFNDSQSCGQSEKNIIGIDLRGGRNRGLADTVMLAVGENQTVIFGVAGCMGHAIQAPSLAEISFTDL